MARVSKYLSLLFMTILVVPAILLFANPVDAQATPMPSAPEFTMKYVNESYTETSTNAYTGTKETTLITNDSIVITITNQPFGYSNYQLYYNIRSKPHFEGNWTEVYPVMTWASSYQGGYNYSYAQYINDYSIQQSKSGYTTISFSVKPTDLYQATGYDVVGTGHYGIPYGSQLDFQVEAQVGHPSQRWVSDSWLLVTDGSFKPAMAYDTSSGWSNTKTISIGEKSSSVQPSSTVPEFSALAVLLLFAVIPVVIALIARKNSNRTRFCDVTYG